MNAENRNKGWSAIIKDYVSTHPGCTTMDIYDHFAERPVKRNAFTYKRSLIFPSPQEIAGLLRTRLGARNKKVGRHETEWYLL